MPSLPSNGRDTKLHNAIFYSIKSLSSSSSLQNNTGSSPLFMSGVDAGITPVSGIHTWQQNQRTEPEKAFPSASARWKVFLWKQTDFHCSLGWTVWCVAHHNTSLTTQKHSYTEKKAFVDEYSHGYMMIRIFFPAIRKYAEIHASRHVLRYNILCYMNSFHNITSLCRPSTWVQSSSMVLHCSTYVGEKNTCPQGIHRITLH